MNILVCGVKRSKRDRKMYTLHGYSPRGIRHPLYSLWCRIKERCLYPARSGFKYYGARGITVCDEWLDSPIIFIKWAKTHGWRRGLQIDRIDNNGPYSPENCHFVTPKQNCRNRRNNVFLTAFGETKIIIEWAEDYRAKAPYETIKKRVRNHGWPTEIAITTPQGVKKEDVL